MSSPHVIPTQGSGAVYDRVAPPHCGEPRPHQRLHIACSACGVRYVPSGTGKSQAWWPCLKACEISDVSHTPLYKGFESRGNACIAWHLKCSGLRQQGGYASNQRSQMREAMPLLQTKGLSHLAVLE